MENITKEELLEELKLSGMTDEDLAKIAGGDGFDPEAYRTCMKSCVARHSREFCDKTCSML